MIKRPRLLISVSLISLACGASTAAMATPQAATQAATAQDGEGTPAGAQTPTPPSDQ